MITGFFCRDSYGKLFRSNQWLGIDNEGGKKAGKLEQQQMLSHNGKLSRGQISLSLLHFPQLSLFRTHLF